MYQLATLKTKTMKTNPIHEYILKSESNLSIAAAIATEWPEARAKLVSAFLERLGARLKKKGWNFEQWGRLFFDKLAGFSIWKPAWNRSISFQCGQYGAHMGIGVSRDTNDTKMLPFHEPLMTAVREIYPSAKPDPWSWWEAYAIMHSPAPDWRKPEVLCRIHKDSKFLTDVADQLLEIAEVSAPIIDGLAKKKTKRKKSI